MQDYSISKCTRKCAVSGRGLEPGESYVSVILADGENVVRQDIASSEWKGPSENAIGWWESCMPANSTRKLKPAPNGVLMDTLSQLIESPGQEPLAYLLALLLMRRRVLAEEDHDLLADSIDEAPTHWQLTSPADGRQWNVPLASPSTDALEVLQEQLNELLFTEE